MSALRIAHPGRPVKLVIDVDHEAGLTPRQRLALELVRAHNGNRCRAARQMGVTVQTVQFLIRAARRRGAMVPDRKLSGGRGPDLAPRRRAA